MAREIPEAVRAVAGLVATVLDETRRLPQTLPSLPVRVLGVAMQVSLKLQQHWTGLVARGDELLTGLRGEAEPGLATFDEDLEPPASVRTGLRNSAFDRAGGDPAGDTEPGGAVPGDQVAADEVAPEDVITDEQAAALPGDPAADAVVAAVEDMAGEVGAAEELLEALDPDVAVTADENALENALLESEPAEEGQEAPDEVPEAAGGEPQDTDGAPIPPDPWGSPVGEEQPAPEPGTTDAAATDGGPVAAAPGPRTDTTAGTDISDAEGAAVDAVGGDSATPTDNPQGAGDLAGSQAAGATPVAGYDSFSIAQLRGHLRGYQRDTVADLLAYEEGTRARAPFVRMLRNRLERLEADAAAG